MAFFWKIMSIPLWVKFRNVLRYVFGFHDMCIKIWSYFPHSFSEQFDFHDEFCGNQDNLISVCLKIGTLIRLSWFPRNSLWNFNCSENECGKQDHIFKHTSWKPNTYLKTLRNFTQRGILMIFFKKTLEFFFTYFNQGNQISLTYQYKKIKKQFWVLLWFIYGSFWLFKIYISVYNGEKLPNSTQFITMHCTCNIWLWNSEKT